MNLASKLRFQRKKAGLTQIEFAQKIGASVATLRRWEAGKTFPDVDKISVISEVLKVKPDEILPDDDNSKSNSNAHSLNPDFNMKADESVKNMLVLENKREGIRYEIPPTEEGYKLFWELYLNTQAAIEKRTQNPQNS